jgi:DNA-directed RNA polymerase specialized sigma24 family protein
VTLPAERRRRERRRSPEHPRQRRRTVGPCSSAGVVCYVNFPGPEAAETLGRHLGGKTSPESAVQSAFKTLFRRHQEGQVRLESWGELFGLLVTIVGRKCLNRNRHYHRGRRAVGRESAEPVDVADREPTPEDAAVLNESIERIMARLSDLEKEVLRHYMAGAEVDAIARDVRCSARTVYRVVEKIKDLIRRSQDEGA